MRKILSSLLIAGLVFTACTTTTSEKDVSEKDVTKNTSKQQAAPKPQTTIIPGGMDKGLRVFADGSMQRNGIRVSPVKNSPEFQDAKLNLLQPKDGADLSGTTNFEFEVENYTLGNQTPDAKDKMCSNSKKGQHIHSILNNKPYNAYYEPKFSQNLDDGYYIHLAFLSRSYHESIKTEDAFQLSEFSVGGATQKLNFDREAPNLFYSRPKGNYIGEGNIEKILLDFFLVNTDLDVRGNKIKLSVNGTEFILTKWVPYFIEGMKLGSNIIVMELIDNKGKKLPGPFNFVQRKVFLYEDEPIIPN